MAAARRDLTQCGALSSLAGQGGFLSVLCTVTDSRIACLAIPATFAAGNSITNRPNITDSPHDADSPPPLPLAAAKAG